MDSILEPFEGYMGEKHVIIPKSIIKSNNSEVVFSVLNPTLETVILKKNAYVASLEPITEIYQQETQASTDVRQDNHGLLTTDLPDHSSPLMSNVSDRLSTDEKNKLKQV